MVNVHSDIQITMLLKYIQALKYRIVSHTNNYGPQKRAYYCCICKPVAFQIIILIPISKCRLSCLTKSLSLAYRDHYKKSQLIKAQRTTDSQIRRPDRFLPKAQGMSQKRVQHNVKLKDKEIFCKIVSLTCQNKTRMKKYYLACHCEWKKSHRTVTLDEELESINGNCERE